MDFTLALETLSIAVIPNCEKSCFLLHSSSSTRSPHLTVANSYSELIKVLGQNGVVVCATRASFFQWCAWTLVALCLGLLRDVGHCAIVIGERGTGKTFLLKQIAAAAVQMVPNLLVCYIQYKVVDPLTPLQWLVRLVKETCGANWDSIESVDQLYTQLQSKGQNVIFYVDELDAVFAGRGSEYSAIIIQLLAISEMSYSPRRIVVVATGSSVCLRRLCFASATEDDRQRFPTYCGRSFNDRKYVLHTVGSLQSVRELLNAKRILKSSQSELCAADNNADGGDDDDTDDTYCMGQLSLTRGVMQCVIDLDIPYFLGTQRRQLITFTEKRNDAHLQKLWCSLLTVLREKMPARLDSVISDPGQWLALPTVSFADMQAADPSILPRDLYEWADKGFLRIADVDAESSHSAHHAVGFAHGTDLMWAIATLSGQKARTSFGKPPEGSLTSQERSCLLNPAGTDLHEQLIAESLACNYEADLCIGEPLRFEYEYHKRAPAELAMAENWNGELYKIVPDTGVDLIAIHDVSVGGVQTLVVCLFQCKMTQRANARLAGKKTPNIPNVEDIYDGFERNIADICSTIFTTDVVAGRQVRIERFLVAPLVASASVRFMLVEKQIRHIDRDQLARLWSPRVTQFINQAGEQCKLYFLLGTTSR